MNFDFSLVSSVHFGVGRISGGERIFHYVMVDDRVQAVLLEMAVETWAAMQKKSAEPRLYEPSEKYEPCEHVYLLLDGELSVEIRKLHTAINFDVDQKALEDAEAMFCYFVKFTDQKGRHLTALRRSNQFKGVLKSCLLSFVNDALKLVDDNVFRLDKDFDLLVDETEIHVLRTKGLEVIGDLKQVILETVGKNSDKLQECLPFVCFDGIREYAKKHSRAANYLASICSAQEVSKIDKRLLLDACNKAGVKNNHEDGMMVIEKRSIIAFLEVLDRRRYESQLVPGETEQYRAPSRMRLR